MKSSFIQQPPPREMIDKPALWFIFQEENLLLHTGNPEQIPQLHHASTLNLNITQELYLGIYDNNHCFAVTVEKDSVPPMGFSFISLRRTAEHLQDESLFLLATRAKQLLFWDKSSRFCGYCSGQTQLSDSEYGKVCRDCGALFYPHVAPVVLILISRGEEILLARSAHFAKNIYSILAGFVEPGETAEQAASRETLEEVGLTINNIRYFASQPWAFPSNLMLGFTAEYVSGELKIDPKEIEDAQWFHSKKLPQLPVSASLSRKMIEVFLQSR